LCDGTLSSPKNWRFRKKNNKLGNKSYKSGISVTEINFYLDPDIGQIQGHNTKYMKIMEPIARQAIICIE
jgi:hypothetical protein